MLFINSYYQLIRGKAGHGGNALCKKLGLQPGEGLPGLLGRAGMDSGLIIGGGGVGFRGHSPSVLPIGRAHITGGKDSVCHWFYSFLHPFWFTLDLVQILLIVTDELSLSAGSSVFVLWMDFCFHP